MGLDGWVLRLGDEKVGMSVRCIVVLVSDVHFTASHASVFFAASHSFSLSRAFARWLILFFSLLSISAYVWPSYSKHESQPSSH
jgi:hypothetical protein